jgi:hypothetical protein
MSPRREAHGSEGTGEPAPLKIVQGECELPVNHPLGDERDRRIFC